MLTAIRPPLPGKLSVRGSSSLDGSKPCFSTQWRATSTRLPLLPLVPSFAATSALLPITIYGTGRPPGPPEPRGAENVPVAAISAAHFCKLVLVLLWDRSWTKITPANKFQGKCWLDLCYQIVNGPACNMYKNIDWHNRKMLLGKASIYCWIRKVFS